MEITYLGHSSFRIKGKSASLVTDPYDPNMVGLKFPKVEADIVTISHDHGDHNMESLVFPPQDGKKKVISGPGEYEVKGVSINGFGSFHDDKKGELRGKNTIYVIYIDEFRLCHLGDLGEGISEETLSQMGDIDILFVPVGGVFTIGPEKAGEVVHSIEPKVIIPMHYQQVGINPQVFSELSTVDVFISKTGLRTERFDRYFIKSPTDLPVEELIAVFTKR